MAKSKKTYTAPEVTVVTFSIEKGFALSTFQPDGMMELYFPTGEGVQETESFDSHGTWLEGTNGFWE